MAEMSQLQLSKFEMLLDYEQAGEEKLATMERELGRAVLTLQGEELHRTITEYRRRYRKTAESVKKLRSQANQIFTEMMETE